MLYETFKTDLRLKYNGALYRENQFNKLPEDDKNRLKKRTYRFRTRTRCMHLSKQKHVKPSERIFIIR